MGGGSRPCGQHACSPDCCQYSNTALEHYVQAIDREIACFRDQLHMDGARLPETFYPGDDLAAICTPWQRWWWCERVVATLQRPTGYGESKQTLQSIHGCLP